MHAGDVLSLGADSPAVERGGWISSRGLGVDWGEEEGVGGWGGGGAEEGGRRWGEGALRADGWEGVEEALVEVVVGVVAVFGVRGSEHVAGEGVGGRGLGRGVHRQVGGAGRGRRGLGVEGVFVELLGQGGDGEALVVEEVFVGGEGDGGGCLLRAVELEGAGAR